MDVEILTFEQMFLTRHGLGRKTRENACIEARQRSFPGLYSVSSGGCGYASC